MATNEKTDQQTMEMKNSEFHQFFIDELKDIYWAELHLVKELPKMKKAATSTELNAAFEKHTQETQTHVDKLEQAFAFLGEEPHAKKCKAMDGLIDEANAIIDDTEKETMTRDAGLILAAQKIEHYEIATYGTLRVYAESMGHQDVAELLGSILENEKATDVALTKISESFVNESASRE